MDLILTDYDFYSCSYGGTLVPRTVFDLFARRAGVLLSSMVWADASEQMDEEKVKMLLCEICDRLYRDDSRQNITRESLDGYDVSYSDGNAIDVELRQLVRQHLGSDGVLYRGRRL